MSSADEIHARKREHMELARGDVEARHSAGWADVALVHAALPELDFDTVDLSTSFLGHRLSAPLLIAGMTGGHDNGKHLNALLARAAERHGLAIGLGSQRAALRDAGLAHTYAVVRDEAPRAFVIGNLGAAQLVAQDGEPVLGVDDVRRAVEMVDADALAVHLNFLEEVVQPEGDRRATGCFDAVRGLADALGDEVPLIAKETGAGLSAEASGRLAEAGLAALDVGGRGGTSFAAVESLRAAARGDHLRARLGETFRDWGLPTAVSVALARRAGIPVIATGGIRTGLDAAKAIALGATLVGVARPLLLAADDGEEELDRAIVQLLTEMRTALFLTGSARPHDLWGARTVVLGETRGWLEQLT